MNEDVELGEETDAQLLRIVAGHLWNLAPAVTGMDQYHHDRLIEIACKLETGQLKEA